MFKFPWGDMHSLNLGWFLQKFNELREDWATAEAGIDGALDAEIQKAEDALSDVFDARDAAAASATAAAGSASAANTSKTAAQNSATAAASSATLANQKATAAGLSEAAAAQSATAASNSATAAATSATQAGNSASAAQSSAAAAAASEAHVEEIIEDATTEAIASATQTATTAATNAANSATAAGNSATAAAGSATAAGNSATAAQSSAAAAEQSAEEAAQSAASLIIDDALSLTSTNALQNKVISGVLDNMPSLAFPIVSRGVALNQHPVPSLTVDKYGSTFKIAGTRGTLGITISLVDNLCEVLTQTDYKPDKFALCPNMSNGAILIYARGSVGSTLAGERIAFSIAAFTENPTSGEASSPSSRRLSASTETFELFKIIPLTDIVEQKVRPVAYLRGNGTYDLEVTFELIVPTAATTQLMGMVLENM